MLRACELYLLVDAAQIIMREKIEFYLLRRLKRRTKRLLGNQPRRSFTKQMRRRLLVFSLQAFAPVSAPLVDFSYRKFCSDRTIRPRRVKNFKSMRLLREAEKKRRNFKICSIRSMSASVRDVLRCVDLSFGRCAVSAA